MFFISEKIEEYTQSMSMKPSPICEEIATFTKENVPMSIMLTGPVEGAFLGFLARLVGAKRILEVGTYTGYSALAMAEHLPDNGELVTLDMNEETVTIAKKYWAKSPHGKKIKSVMGPALESMAKLEGPFDLVFIDAAKKEYGGYLEHALRMLSSRGVIAVDNTLYTGMVLHPDTGDANGQAMRKFNEAVKARKDTICVMLPIRDGVTLIQKV